MANNAPHQFILSIASKIPETSRALSVCSQTPITINERRKLSRRGAGQMEAIFWSFLTHWLAHKFIDSSVDLLATKIDESAPSLLDQPGDSGWTGGAWSEDQRRVIEILQKTRTLQGGRWRAWLQREAKRPILLIGASGTGKSVLALRLLGTEPSGSIVMSPREVSNTLLISSPGRIHRRSYA